MTYTKQMVIETYPFDSFEPIEQYNSETGIISAPTPEIIEYLQDLKASGKVETTDSASGLLDKKFFRIVELIGVNNGEFRKFNGSLIADLSKIWKYTPIARVSVMFTFSENSLLITFTNVSKADVDNINNIKSEFANNLVFDRDIPIFFTCII